MDGYLIHYGMPERSGRYAWGSGDRPYQRLEKRAGRMERRVTKKLGRADKIVGKKQNIANKAYQRAIKKSSGMFASKRKVDKYMNKAAKAQYKVNKVELRASQLFQKYSKKFEKLNVTMDKDLKTRGLDYFNRAANASKSMYSAALMRTM